jgi:hypothetical protein
MNPVNRFKAICLKNSSRRNIKISTCDSTIENNSHTNWWGIANSQSKVSEFHWDDSKIKSWNYNSANQEQKEDMTNKVCILLSSPMDNGMVPLRELISNSLKEKYKSLSWTNHTLFKAMHKQSSKIIHISNRVRNGTREGIHFNRPWEWT